MLESSRRIIVYNKEAPELAKEFEEEVGLLASWPCTPHIYICYHLDACIPHIVETSVLPSVQACGTPKSANVQKLDKPGDNN
jgi:hypothetical protein